MSELQRGQSNEGGSVEQVDFCFDIIANMKIFDSSSLGLYSKASHAIFNCHIYHSFLLTLIAEQLLEHYFAKKVLAPCIC